MRSWTIKGRRKTKPRTGLERWPSSLEHLFLQSTRVQFLEPTWCLTTIYNSSSRVSNALVWFLKARGTYMKAKTFIIHIQLNNHRIWILQITQSTMLLWVSLGQEPLPAMCHHHTRQHIFIFRYQFTRNTRIRVHVKWHHQKATESNIKSITI